MILLIDSNDSSMYIAQLCFLYLVVTCKVQPKKNFLVLWLLRIKRQIHMNRN